ncbi:MAG: ArnT family glycosyltransferase [Phycisphaeraceae bacterium]
MSTLEAAKLESRRRPADAVLAALDRHRGKIALGIVLLYAIGFNGQWRIRPDTALYADLARSLVEGGGFTGPDGRPSHAQPGLPRLIAASFRLTGSEALWPMITLMWLLGLATLWLCYDLFKRAIDRPVALAVTCLLAVNGLFYQHAFEVLTDLPFLFGLLLVLGGGERWHHATGRSAWAAAGMVLAGLLVMAAMRTVFLTFLAAAGLTGGWYLLRGGWRRWRLLLPIGGVMGLVFVLVRLLDPRLSGPAGAVPDEQRALTMLTADLPRTLRAGLTQELPVLLAESLPEAVTGTELSVVGTPLMLAFLVLSLAILLRKRVFWGLLVLGFAAQSVLLTEVITRYLLPVLPLLALAWWWIAAEASRRLPGPWDGAVFAGMLLLWVGPNLAMTGKLAVEQRQVPFLAHYDHGRYVPLARLAEQLQAHTPEDAFIVQGLERDEELGYLADRRVVDAAAGHWPLLQQAADAESLYLVMTSDAPLEAWRAQLRLDLGAPLARVTAEVGEPPWTLHAAEPTPLTRDEIAWLHRRILRRDPATRALDHWQRQLSRRDALPAQLVMWMLDSQPFRRRVAPAVKLHLVYLRQPPTDAALDRLLAGPGDWPARADRFARSDAFERRHGSVYRDPSPGRFATWLADTVSAPAGREQAWRKALEQGKATRSGLLIEAMELAGAPDGLSRRTRAAMLGLALRGGAPAWEEVERWADRIDEPKRLFALAARFMMDPPCPLAAESQ